MSNSRRAAALALAGVLGGCAINQTVTPVGRVEGGAVCIIENPAVRTTFLEAYQRSLQNRGYEVRKLPPDSPLRSCPVTTTYTANWRWDLAMYMAYAELNVFKDGAPAGKAVYDAMAGGGNLNKFINAEEKLRELVGQLFPPRA